ncbi:hypothetical protein PUN28_005536 [Cardiocondyla obscurior]|uniref:Uncharacterized protein n=1 Tax=Cardiocondyla obscurior TaxID=286306 RepID=A0AAW2GLM9_9HYME
MRTGLPIRGGRVIDRVVGGSHARTGSPSAACERREKEEDRPVIKRRTGTRLHDSPYPDNYRATGMPIRNRALRTNANAASLASLLLGRTTRSSRPTVALRHLPLSQGVKKKRKEEKRRIGRERRGTLCTYHSYCLKRPSKPAL